jgi:hypothetical protein
MLHVAFYQMFKDELAKLHQKVFQKVERERIFKMLKTTFSPNHSIYPDNTKIKHMHIHIHTYEKKAVAPNPLNT